jgi:hypothetical protein
MATRCVARSSTAYTIYPTNGACRKIPADVLCAWIGSSERVAQNHYPQVTNLPFQKAAQKAAAYPSTSGSSNAKQQYAASRDNERELR